MKNQKLLAGALILVIVVAIAWVVYSSVHKPAPDSSAFKVPPPTVGAHPVFILHKRIPVPAATLGGGTPRPAGQGQ